MNILFICTANRDRSKTAEHHFAPKHPQHVFKSCGTNEYYCKTWKGTFLKREHLEWADKIFCMYQNHLDDIHDRFGKVFDHKITNLQIEDVYHYKSEKLIKILEEKVIL